MKPRRLPPLNALKAFEASARHLSFSVAAQELHVSHSAISQQVKLLESWLEIHLFIRKNNGISLTESGYQYLQTIRPIFDSLHTATELLQSEKTNVVLTISVLPNFAIHWLLPKLHDFQRLHPRISLQLLSTALPLDSLYESCDLAIRPYQPMTNYHFDKLCTAQLLPVFSPAFQEKHRISNVTDLQLVPKLHVKQSQQDWQHWLEHQHLTEQNPRATMAFDSHAIAIEAAKHGYGALMAQMPFINHLIEQKELLAPFNLPLDSDRSWYLVSPNSGLPSKAQLFKDWLLETHGPTKD